MVCAFINPFWYGPSFRRTQWPATASITRPHTVYRHARIILCSSYSSRFDVYVERRWVTDLVPPAVTLHVRIHRGRTARVVITGRRRSISRHRWPHCWWPRDASLTICSWQFIVTSAELLRSIVMYFLCFTRNTIMLTIIIICFSCSIIKSFVYLKTLGFG